MKILLTEKVFDYRTIKTFEDACKRIGEDPDNIKYLYRFSDSIIAHYKLSIIFKAINNGWEPDFCSWEQLKYYCLFSVTNSYGYDCVSESSPCCIELYCGSMSKVLYITNTFKEEYSKFLL